MINIFLLLSSLNSTCTVCCSDTMLCMTEVTVAISSFACWIREVQVSLSVDERKVKTMCGIFDDVTLTATIFRRAVRRKATDRQPCTKNSTF